MGGGHHGGGLGAIEAVAAKDSPVHRLDPRVKILGLIGLIFVAVTLPTGAWAAFGALAAILIVLTAASRLRPTYVLGRMTIEVPFLLAAAILPFTSRLPSSGLARPVTRLNSVLLPAPFGPIIPTLCPFSTANDTFFSA